MLDFRIIRNVRKAYVLGRFCCYKLQSPRISRSYSSYIDVNECNGIREITLNEPKTRNSLSMAMMEAILTAVNDNWLDKSLRCIILQANGNVWSAGHNLKELSPSSRSLTNQQKDIFDKLTQIINSIHQAPVPVIAKVNGLAAAAGCQLVASCDIIVATQNSRFSTPGASFGIFCSTPGIAISRIMSRPQAAYMLMTGLTISAQEAYAAGLVSRVVAEEDLEKEMKHIIDAIREKSRAVISFGKAFFYEQLRLPIEQAYCLGSQKMADNLHLDDGQEGLRSFIEKRKANWKHE